MPPIRDSVWKVGTIEIAVEEDEGVGRKQRIDAKRYGFFAVHSLYNSQAKRQARVRELGLIWSLTHVATGLRVALFSREAEAEAAGEYLMSKCCLVFRLRTKEEIEEKVPPWLVLHLKECFERRQWFEPKEKTK